jgi:hypothetical protein
MVGDLVCLLLVRVSWLVDRWLGLKSYCRQGRDGYSGEALPISAGRRADYIFLRAELQRLWHRAIVERAPKD